MIEGPSQTQHQGNKNKPNTHEKFELTNSPELRPLKPNPNSNNNSNENIKIKCKHESPIGLNTLVVGNNQNISNVKIDVKFEENNFMPYKHFKECEQNNYQLFR